MAERAGACFVTLTEGGRLRGCIGSLVAHRSLGKDVTEHAVDAATRDPRFNPVTAAEYPLLNVEVSVLGAPEPITVNSCDADLCGTGSKTATLASLQSGPQTDASNGTAVTSNARYVRALNLRKYYAPAKTV